MKKLGAKMRRIRMTRWGKLTLGEKIAKVTWTLIKIAVIGAIIFTVVGAAAAVIGGVVIAIGIGNAIGGGFSNASYAYRPGDRYIRFW